jgi:methyl-accepting chemotaxis protein
MHKDDPKNPIERLENLAITVTKGIGSIWSVIIHTVVFIVSFSLVFFGISFDRVLLVLTTILSLEAIYLSIFIQMSVNRQAKAIAGVEKDIDEISHDVEEIAEDVEGIQEDVEEIAEDVEEIAEDVEGIQEDMEEIQEDIDEMQEEAEDIDQKLDRGSHV